MIFKHLKIKRVKVVSNTTKKDWTPCFSLFTLTRREAQKQFILNGTNVISATQPSVSMYRRKL